jgi:hypothetical protein
VRAGAETASVPQADPVATTQRQVPVEDPVLGARRPEDL